MEYDYWLIDIDEGEADTVETGLVTLMIRSKDSIGNEEWYRTVFTFRSDWDTIIETVYFAEREDCLLISDSLNTPDTFLLLPLEGGKRWELSLPFLAWLTGENYRYGAENRGKERVKVLAGEYPDTYKIEYTNIEEDISGHFWVAKDIGLVKLSLTEGEAESYSLFNMELKAEE